MKLQLSMKSWANYTKLDYTFPCEGINILVYISDNSNIKITHF